MSVINRVLAQLERRGVYVEQEQDMVRAVPPQRSRRMSLLLAALLLSLGGWWWQGRGAADDPKQRVAISVAPVATVAPAMPGPASGIVAPEVVASPSGVPAAVPAAVPAMSAVAAVQPIDRIPPAPKSVPQPPPKPAPLPKAVVSAPPKPVVSAVRPTATPRTAPPVQSASRVAASKPETDFDKPAMAAPAAADGMPMKQISRSQQAEAEFRKGIELMQQGRSAEASASYQAALQLDAAHDASRQALVALLLEGKRRDEAERLLQERLEGRPEHAGFAMLLARLQVERGATGEALATLERSLPHAEAKADYRAFLAALQQRNNLHADAATHYQAALRLQPGNGAWLMGYGISLQALRRTEEAKAAYRQALESKNLSPDLKAFVQRKLNGL